MADGGNSYYFKLRGRPMGPFSLDEMRQKVRTAQVTQGSDVSTDGVSWQKAGAFPEVFVRAERDAGPGRWYYALHGETQGPVPLTTLQQYVSSRTVGEGDMVLREGTENWLPARAVPELAMVIPKPEPVAVGGNGGVGPPIVINTGSVSQESPSNGMAIAGFVLSLIGCVLPCLAPLGFIFSMIALNGKNRANRGLAIAGAILGGLMTVFIIIYIVFVIVVAAANAAV